MWCKAAVPIVARSIAAFGQGRTIPENVVRLVSSRSGEEIRRLKARNRVALPLRQLAANLMRVANGAGKPTAIVRQLSDCLVALREYCEAHQAAPTSEEFYEILRHESVWREHRPWIEQRRQDARELDPGDTSEDEREEAMQEIRRGALQMVAAMLLNQTPQRSSGEHRIAMAIRNIEEIRRQKSLRPPVTYERTMEWLRAHKAKRRQGKRDGG
jgi:hypothetical protein